MSRSRRIVTCYKCGVMFDLWGAEPRCPGCNEPYDETNRDLPPLPAWRPHFADELESPEFEGARKPEPETAPAHEFVAAGVLLVSFFMVLAGVMMADATLFLVGLTVMGIIAFVLGILAIRKHLQGGRDELRPGMLSQLFGWDYWRRR